MNPPRRPLISKCWMQKIGELALENDFYPALTKAGLLSAKQ